MKYIVMTDEMPDRCLDCELLYNIGKLFVCTVSERKRVVNVEARPDFCPLILKRKYDVKVVLERDSGAWMTEDKKE